MVKQILIFIFLIGISFSNVVAQNTTPFSDKLKETIKSRVNGGLNTGIVIGLIDSSGMHYYSFGYKSLKTGESVDENAVFEIGSISKTFTGILLAQNVLNGTMDLNDPLQKYLPEGITAPTRNGKMIRLIHLANHTSGLPRMPTNFASANPANPYVDYSKEQLFEFIDEYKLDRDIGKTYEYSNYAMGLLGFLLASDAGVSYEELLKKRITTPLNMPNTSINLSPAMRKNLAIGHSRTEEVENWDFTTLSGAGGIRSTAKDMLKYIAANMGKEQTDLYPAMKLSHQNTREPDETPIVGLAWHTTKFGDLKIVWHNGGTGGYRTFAGFTSDGHKGVVVLSNSDVSVDDIGIHLLNPSSPLTKMNPPISVKIRDIIEEKGVQAGIKTYWKLKQEKPDEFNFSEPELNNLGYFYMRKNEIDKAIAVFKLNVEAFPDAFNTYDSLGEAYLEKGDKEKAIDNYITSVELNPGNQGGIQKLKELGVNPEEILEEVKVDEKTLDLYLGKYELLPGFLMTVTRDGTQLKVQATGQQNFPVFPKSQNVFYYKIVDAQITFNINEEGTVDSLTLLQGGQELTGKKLEE